MTTDLTKLTRDNIVSLLEAEGYESQEINEVEFDCVVNRNELRYKIMWTDLDGDEQEGFVYVLIDSNGKLVADY